MSLSVSNEHVSFLMALADGIVNTVKPEDLESYVDSSVDRNFLEEYCNTYTKPSEIPGFGDVIKEVINESGYQAIRLLILLLTVFSSRVLSPSLTGSLKLVTEMSQKEKEELLLGWSNSYIKPKRRLFRLIYILSVTTFVRLSNELHNDLIGFPGKETRQKLHEGQPADDFRYEMMQKPAADNAELHLPEFDVLIMGSGAGAGVTAHSLSNAGHKCLVLEKGEYFRNSELNFNEDEGFKSLYEKGAGLTSSSNELLILAGSTFGGGTTVNWSACLKTPFKVRKEWYDEFNIEWAATEAFDQCLDFVWQLMGASTENIKHSFSNQVLLEGSQKLGHPHKEVAQNTGGHANHSCGFCYLGCKHSVKQGSSEFWFREASLKGSKFMEEVRVKKILHKNGKAAGVLCENVVNKRHFTITGPKKFVVAGGSLNTPIILKNSGFRNKHIGRNLKLHPVTVMLGDFGKECVTKPHENSILTSINTNVEDLDGKGHGVRIETVVHSPALESYFMPWSSSTNLRRSLSHYNSYVALLLLCRDTSSGKVSPDSKNPDTIIVDYNVNDFDRKALAVSILEASDILYIEGAKEIFHPQNYVSSFKSTKPKEARSITDNDYIEWRNMISRIKLDTYSTPYGSAHQMGTCRMSGKGPRYGACDPKGRLFECKNIYIADTSAFPTASGSNPMITVMALAKLVSLGLIDDLRPQMKL